VAAGVEATPVVAELARSASSGELSSSGKAGGAVTLEVTGMLLSAALGRGVADAMPTTTAAATAMPATAADVDSTGARRMIPV